MTQPLPDAAAQKQAALEVFAQYEPPLYQAYLDMIAEWLAAVRVAMFAGGVVKLALVPDPFTVFTQTPKWDALMNDYAFDVAREVIATPYKDILGNGVVFDSRPFVRNYIAQRANKLKNTPNEVYSMVSQIVDSATTNGASIPDVQHQVEELLDATHGDTWTNRARTVARTEVVGAYNGGLHDAFAMLVEATPGDWRKRWLATDDTRTRPDHREADGQVVPWGTPFVVGGYHLMHPHDPTAPAKEVVNCRCVELLEKGDNPTDMSNRQFLGAGATLAQLVDPDCIFCLQTHKPGLCKGQKRGETEPGEQDRNELPPAKKAQIAVAGLSQAIARAQQIEARLALSDPKAARAARRALIDYGKALRGHQKTLRQAAYENARAKQTADRDARDQDRLDRQAVAQKKRAERRAAREKVRAEKKAEREKVARMTPKQRAAYRRQLREKARKK